MIELLPWALLALLLVAGVWWWLGRRKRGPDSGDTHAMVSAMEESSLELRAHEESVEAEAERKMAKALLDAKHREIDAQRLAAEREAAQLIAAQRHAAEEAERLEAERLHAEYLEAERAAKERATAEEEARKEADRNEFRQKAAAALARQEAEQREAEEAMRVDSERRRAEAAAALEAELRAQRQAIEQREAEAAALQEAARLRAQLRAAEQQAAEAAARERQAREQAEADARQAALRAAELAARIAAAPPAAPPIAPPIAPPAALRKAPEHTTVMVADDSKVVRVKTSRVLAKYQYRIVLAEDGLDALRQIEQSPPDVLITDVEMPGMDGFELTRRVRADPRTAAIPIIMVTSAEEALRQQARDVGVNLLLGKPYDDAALIAQIEASLGLPADS